MEQRRFFQVCLALIFLMSLLISACSERPSGESTEPTSPSTRATHAEKRTSDRVRVTVASLVPAATDLILDMGAGGHLVAVSNYDERRAETDPLPRVGDYQSTDWEQIATLKPALMIRQFAPDRVPPGLQERADALGITLLNLQIEKISDILAAYITIGEAIGEPGQAMNARNRLQTRLESIRRMNLNEPKVRAAILIDAEATAVIGADTFLDELLSLAGGTNVAAGLGQRYPSIDREMLIRLDPDVIIQLLPGASPQVLSKSQETWGGLRDLRAVRDKRVTTFSETFTLLPASRVADVASMFAEALHPQQRMSRGVATTAPTESDDQLDGSTTQLPIPPTQP